MLHRRPAALVLLVAGVSMAVPLIGCGSDGAPSGESPTADCTPVDTGGADGALGGSNTTLVGGRAPDAPTGGQPSADQSSGGAGSNSGDDSAVVPNPDATGQDGSSTGDAGTGGGGESPGC